MTKYIDVTRLLEWSGRYTGMERFAYEITKTLRGEEDVRLCGYVRDKGFVSLDGHTEVKGGRLISDVLKPTESLRQLFVSNKRIFARHYAGRKRLSYKQKQLSTVQFSKKDTLLIYDGLWDRGDYIEAVESAIAQGAQLAHVVHDLVPLVMPHMCFEYVTDAFRGYFDRIAPRIDTLFSISKSTQSDFLKVYGHAVKSTMKQVLIRHGEDFEAGDTKKPRSLSKLDAGTYLLTVGTVEIRKNHQLLYQAYRLAYEQGIQLPPIVIVGRMGWMSEGTVHMIRKDPAVADKFIFAGPVDDSELNWLYSNALFTVFPALYEGWGLPVAESLFHGKVCAATNSSSVPEIGGVLNKYYSPYDALECLKVIQGLMNDRQRAVLEKQIREQYTPTAWVETGRRIGQNI